MSDTFQAVNKRAAEIVCWVALQANKISLLIRKNILENSLILQKNLSKRALKQEINCIPCIFHPFYGEE